MSKRLKLIVPLLDEEITLDDLSEKAGFIDAYTDDINRPYLDNHVFLLYIANVEVKECYNRTIKFKTLKSLYNILDVRIKGVLCKLYAFCIINPTIKSLMKNPFMLDDVSKLRILTFWKAADESINEYFVKGVNSQIEDFIRTSVPEWDYQKFYIRIQKKGAEHDCA